VTVTAVQLALVDAVCTAGARYAAAGGGEPERITTESDVLIDNTDGYYYNGMAFASDSMHLWVNSYANFRDRMYNLDGTVDWQSSAGNRMLGGAYDAANRMWYSIMAVGGNTVIISSEIPRTTRNIVLAGATTMANLAIVPGHESVLWACSNYATPLTIIEYNVADGSATGRSINTGINGYGDSLIGGIGPDGIRSLWIATNFAVVKRYNEVTLALLDTWTLNASLNDAPTSRIDGVGLDLDGQILALRGYGGAGLVKLTAAGAAGLTAADMMYGGNAEWGGAGSAYYQAAAGTSWGQGITCTPDGRYVAFGVLGAAETFSSAVRIVNRSTQRARWTKAYGPGMKIDLIAVPGLLGNKHGTIVGGLQNALCDHVTTKVYYSFDGIARTQINTVQAFSPVQLDVSNQTLYLDVEMNIWGKPAGPAPQVWAPVLVEDDGVPNYTRRPGYNEGYL
jgi:hypothetical protein